MQQPQPNEAQNFAMRLRRAAQFFLTLALCLGVSSFVAAKKTAGNKIKEESFANCLLSSKKKYELYEKCIGKVTSACLDNYDAYKTFLKDFSIGSVELECSELESRWWSELFKEKSAELKYNVALHLKDKKIQEALDKTLATLRKRFAYECGYVSTRWGQGKQNIYENFKCGRDISAENAIIIFLWNEQLKILENIK